MPAATIRDVLVVDDQVILRLGLRMMLETTGGFSIREAEDGQEAVAECEKATPHLVLMDLQMPVMDGLKATQIIQSRFPTVKVLILTSFTRDEDIFAAFAAGAHGYCLKDISHQQLLRAISAVAEGAIWIDAAIADRVLRNVSSPMVSVPPKKSSNPDGKFGLTAREMEVLGLVAKGMTNPEIAQTLYLSQDTVKSHVAHIMEKLTVSDRTEAAVKALRQGLL
jgi:two-component system, NarL family, response regulator LiaR